MGLNTRRNKAYYAHAGMQKALIGKKLDTRLTQAAQSESVKDVTKAVNTSDDCEDRDITIQ